jgi:hypothetical protein
MPEEIHEYLMRPRRYDNIDGTGEMAMGVMMLGFALVLYLQSILPRTSIWMHGWTSMLFMYVIMVPVLCLGYWGVKAIKKYVTYPRTGYVAFPPVTKSGALPIVLIVSAAVGAAVTFFVIRFARWHDAMTLKRAITVALLVAPYGWFIFRLGGEHRWKWFVLTFLAAGLVVISLAVPGDMIAYCRLAFPFVGGVWVASGVATLYLYLRCTQAPSRETE